MMGTLLRLRHLLVALAATAVVLAGCNGDGNGDDTGAISGANGDQDSGSAATATISINGTPADFDRARCESIGSTEGAWYQFHASGEGMQFVVKFDEVGGPADSRHDAEFDFSGPPSDVEYGADGDGYYSLAMHGGETDVTAAEDSQASGTATLGTNDHDDDVEIEFEIHC